MDEKASMMQTAEGNKVFKTPEDDAKDALLTNEEIFEHVSQTFAQTRSTFASNSTSSGFTFWRPPKMEDIVRLRAFHNAYNLYGLVELPLMGSITFLLSNERKLETSSQEEQDTNIGFDRSSGAYDPIEQYIFYLDVVHGRKTMEELDNAFDNGRITIDAAIMHLYRQPTFPFAIQTKLAPHISPIGYVCAEVNNVKMLDWLLSKGAPIKGMKTTYNRPGDKCNQTAVHVACEHQHMETLNWLVSNDVPIEWISKAHSCPHTNALTFGKPNGRTPFSFCLLKNEDPIPVWNWLIENGALGDIDRPITDNPAHVKFTPMYYATYHYNIPVIYQTTIKKFEKIINWLSNKGIATFPRVELCGLVGAAHLNGRVGFRGMYNETKDRYEVVLDDLEGENNGMKRKSCLVKEVNFIVK